MHLNTKTIDVWLAARAAEAGIDFEDMRDCWYCLSKETEQLLSPLQKQAWRLWCEGDFLQAPDERDLDD